MMQKGEVPILKALVIGILLIPANYYWIARSEMVLFNFPTIVVPFYNVIVSLLVLMIFSLLLRKISPKSALSHRDLLIVYIILSVASSIGSTSMTQEMPEAMSHGFWFATEENEWETLIWKHIPSWLTVNNKNTLKDFYEGDSSLYVVENIVPFLSPIFWWSIFFLSLLLNMWCINILLRKQWSEHERLNYPVTQLPFEMTSTDLGFFKRKLMWIGLAVAASICIINGISFLYPVIPTIPVKSQDISRFFTEKPWNAIGRLTISFYPFFIGLSFLMPLDLSFSCWFFYLFYKAELMLGGVFGWSSNSFHFGEQLFGIFIGIFLVILWKARSYLKQIILYFFGINSFSFLFVQTFLLIVSFDQTFLSPLTKGVRGLSKRKVWRKSLVGKGRPDSRDEAMKYRFASFGIIICTTILILFSARIGVSLWAAVIFLAGYFMFSVVISRIRAEFGYPVHNLDSASVNSLVVSVLGSRNFNRQSLTGLALYSFFNIEYEGHPMPIQLEALKLADRSHLSSKRLTWIIVLVSAFSIPIGFFLFLDRFYKLGADSGRMNGWVLFHGWRTFGLLERWLSYPTNMNYRGITFIGVGFVFSLLLMFMRSRFLRFPFHPLGYAVAVNWEMGELWSCILFTWLVKTVILKYGGLRLYRRTIPFFLGLILGDFVIGGLWDILSIVINTPTYSIWP